MTRKNPNGRHISLDSEPQCMRWKGELFSAEPFEKFFCDLEKISQTNPQDQYEVFLIDDEKFF